MVVKMYPMELIDKVKAYFEKVKCLQKTAQVFDLPLSTTEYMVKNDYGKKKKRRGRRSVLSPRENLQIKREVKRLETDQERVTARKVKENCNLTCHQKTVERRLKKMNMKYKNNTKKLS
ncbi:uncharacterized protein LOC141854134 [Brevipalpus obovatus]|uniref:uncharacterized protein LOC141854134 n=1 Tax=Brevipalpus obovatus TaxID=246614 RepID=UPI003D9F9F7B